MTTTNVFATTANVETLNVWQVSNLSSLSLTNNLYAANAVTTTNVFVSNGLDVGPGTLGTNVVVFSNISGGSNVFVMDSNGRIGIGKTNPGVALDVVGAITASGNITSASDRRVKSDIKNIEGALDKVTQIGGYTFTRMDEPHKGTKQAGVIAQEIIKVLPEVVQISEETGYYSVSYGNITALLIEALKEERIERLKLEERLARLEN